MKYRRNRHFEENAHLERWLISYADYMTLMFALFVVLYAFALAKEENYRYLSESLSDIFHLAGPRARQPMAPISCRRGKVSAKSTNTPRDCCQRAVLSRWRATAR